MANLRICPINFFDEATLTETPAMVTTMPATNAQLTARGDTARSTSSATQTIKGTWGGATRKIDSFFAFRHNGQGGLCQLLLYPNADWTGTPYDSTALALSTAITSSSYDWGTAAASPDSDNDLLLSDAPYSLFFTLFTAKSFSIVFSSCDRAYWDIGRVYLGKYLEAPYNPKYGMVVSEEYNDIQTRTKGGSLRTRAGEKWHDLKIDMFYANEATRALWRDLISKIQMNTDVAVSVFPGVGGRDERDHVFNMQLKSPTAFNWSNVNFNEASYNFTEV